MTAPLRRVVPALVVGLALVLGVCGCSLESVPLPSLVSGPKYPLQARFHNALNLPQGAPVKLGGNVVGTVGEIRARSYVAQVTLLIKKGTTVPKGTRAEVRTTAPMGEAFVELTPPADEPATAMGAGDVFPLSATATART